MSDRRPKDVRVWHRQGSWSETIPAAEVMLVRHLHDDHAMSVRQINRKLGMTDRMVRACLLGVEHGGNGSDRGAE